MVVLRNLDGGSISSGWRGSLLAFYPSGLAMGLNPPIPDSLKA